MESSSWPAGICQHADTQFAQVVGGKLACIKACMVTALHVAMRTGIRVHPPSSLAATNDYAGNDNAMLFLLQT